MGSSCTSAEELKMKIENMSINIVFAAICTEQLIIIIYD